MPDYALIKTTPAPEDFGNADWREIPGGSGIVTYSWDQPIQQVNASAPPFRVPADGVLRAYFRRTGTQPTTAGTYAALLRRNGANVGTQNLASAFPADAWQVLLDPFLAPLELPVVAGDTLEWRILTDSVTGGSGSVFFQADVSPE